MLVLDNINSVSDVITNSSSELFVINDENTTLDLFKSIINPVLSGCYEPFIFDLNTFRDWEKKYEGEECIDDRSKCFQIINDWFTDLESFGGLVHYIGDTIWRSRLEDYIKMEHNQLKELYSELIKHYDAVYLSYEEVEAFLLTYDKDKINEIVDYLLNTDFEYDIRKLDGKIILLSEDENSISYSEKFNSTKFTGDCNVFQWIDLTFNNTHYHLD